MRERRPKPCRTLMYVCSVLLYSIFFLLVKKILYACNVFPSQAKRTEIKENLLMDLQEKKKSFENLRSTMEITTGSCEFQ